MSIVKSITISQERLIAISILFMTFYTAPLFSYCPIRFSDIGCFFILWLSIRRSRKVVLSPNFKFAVLLILWCIADSFFLSQSSHFSIINHYTQFLRLLFALLLYIYVPNLWKDIKLKNTMKILKYILILHLIIQISYAVIYIAGAKMLFNIVSTYEERAYLISANNLFFNHFIIVNTSSGYPRFSGFFEEPAWFGWTLNLIIAIILQYQYNYRDTILTKRDYILIILGFSVTSSISAIFSLMTIMGVYFYLKNKRNRFKFISTIIIAISSTLAAIILFSQSLSNRVLMIFAGNDGSSNFRLIGSWNGLITLLANNPLTGYGLGDDNKFDYYNTLQSNAFHGISINGNEIIDMHNMLFQITCNLGIIGGVLFLSLLYGLSFKKSPIIIIGIILTYFSVNVFNTYFFFLIISISTFYFSHKLKFKT